VTKAWLISVDDPPDDVVLTGAIRGAGGVTQLAKDKAKHVIANARAMKIRARFILSVIMAWITAPRI
jgi:hypothetical protein